eukprot:TRINITY_DN8853_c0_g1_i1.p2 TRINITY_DN8853_c0_g1~~TRINITY_DN8853_c0_g1_i1.p2  ORF type:complete len:50 (-),score=5.72 TRINITY_DN8853_c0_g1_i1:752-901(-)
MDIILEEFVVFGGIKFKFGKRRTILISLRNFLVKCEKSQIFKIEIITFM